MGKRHLRAVCFVLAALVLLALSSCTPKLTDIYYAEGDIASSNMLIFSGDAGGLLEEGLGAGSGNTVIAVTMGVTEQGTYTISGDKIIFKFGDVNSTATYDKKTDTITWYGVRYIKPASQTAAPRATAAVDIAE